MKTFNGWHFALLALLFAIILLPAVVGSDETADLRKDLAVIQARIALERALYQEAKAKMERSELVAQFLLPQLREREKALQEKIREMESALRLAPGG